MAIEQVCKHENINSDGPIPFCEDCGAWERNGKFEPAEPSTPAAEPPRCAVIACGQKEDGHGMGLGQSPHDFVPSSPPPAQEPQFKDQYMGDWSAPYWQQRAEAAEARLAALPSEEEIARVIARCEGKEDMWTTFFAKRPRSACAAEGRRIMAELFAVGLICFIFGVVCGYYLEKEPIRQPFIPGRSHED